jgi:hypothetical protein
MGAISDNFPKKKKDFVFWNGIPCPIVHSAILLET